jgi:chloramphenicol-sensitive protein RarD
LSTFDKDARDGVIAALGAYLIWGFLPVYFKVVADIAPMEVLAHRIVWAIPFGAVIIIIRRQWSEVGRAFADPKMMVLLSLSTVFIGLNWYVYIWAIQDSRILETSLGYYINPLTNILAGYWIFGERLRRFQKMAVAFATIGVLVLTISGGVVPWVALFLAISFTVYAAVRKKAVIGGMPGLFIETLLLLPIAVVWFAYLHSTATIQFLGADSFTTFWLLMAGPATALPLLLFALAARRLKLTTISFMQFIAPTIQFCSGIYFGEPLSTAHIICFGFIWSAAAFFIYDAVKSAKKKPLLKVSTEA